MRIAITGATGNCGTALVRALSTDPAVDEVIGIVRRRPDWQPRNTIWRCGDVARDDLRRLLHGADVVVHLAWLIQPSRNQAITDAVNIEGSKRVFQAAVDVGASALIHASSVAAYSPANVDEPVDETWPTNGILSSYYSRQKVAAERALDAIEADHPQLRVARMRPGLVFQYAAASEIRRFFGGPLVAGRLADPRLIPFVPQLEGLGGQVVHADDLAEAYRLLCLRDHARGAFNIGTNPPLDAEALARLLGARPVPLPRTAVRRLVDLSWRARLHPVSPDWLDIATNVPVMLTDRLRALGWTPRFDSGEVLLELMAGLRDGAGFDTPPLASDAGGLLRRREFRTGIGGPNARDRASAAALRPDAPTPG